MKDSNNLYTKEEIQELEHWFDSKELPKSLQLDKATYIPDLKETLHRLFLQADQCYEKILHSSFKKVHHSSNFCLRRVSFSTFDIASFPSFV